MGSEVPADTQPFSDPDGSPAEASVLRMLLAAQLRRLAEVAEQPQVRLQVILSRPAATPARAGPSPSCGSGSRTCRTWSTSSRSPESHDRDRKGQANV